MLIIMTITFEGPLKELRKEPRKRAEQGHKTRKRIAKQCRK